MIEMLVKITLVFWPVVVLSLVEGHSFTMNPRIINGALGFPERYPYFVQVRTIEDKVEFSCGGTLISDR